MLTKRNVMKRTAYPMVDAGDLRHQVQLATANASQDAAGQPLTAWVVYRTCWAAIRQLSGQQMFQSNEFASAAQVRITVRHPGQGVLPVVRVGDRVFYDGHVYVIQIIDDIEMRHVLMNLNCLEIDGTS